MNKVAPICKSNKQTIEVSDLQLLVDDYLYTRQHLYDVEDQWWGDKTITWEQAIERAWNSRRWNGKMHAHQCRVAHKLPEGSEGLEVAKADKMRSQDFKDFQSLYDWVKSVVLRVKGLGAMTAYDVTQSLGLWLGLEPVVLYLHAGTAVGARKFGIEKEIAPLSAFPKEIQALGATHAEHFLCIYKSHISFIMNNKTNLSTANNRKCCIPDRTIA